MDRRKILEAEWSPKNEKPFSEYTNGSNFRAWWKCKKSKCNKHHHEWQTSISNRFQGKGCPFCSGHKFCLCNSLASLRPDLASEWHPFLNESLTPEMVSISSGKKIWWRCEKNECEHPHDWQSFSYVRIKGHGCPFCAGQRVCPCNSLAELRPDLASQWHPIKNGTLTPESVSIGSNKKAWWKCDKKDCKHSHDWQANIVHRTKGNGCPFCSGRQICVCNSLAKLRPDLAAEWHPTKNGNISPEQISVSSDKKAWWKCEKNECEHQHVWQARLYSRANGHGCPYCAGQKVCPCNSLASVRPKIASEWHPTKNGDLKPNQVSVNSGKKAWWKCDQSKCHHPHVWQAVIGCRTNGHNCHFCSGHKFCPCNSFAQLRPKIASEWHPTKNGNLSPKMFSVSSGKKAWWKCREKSHEWETSINDRTRKNIGTNCPFCNSSKGEKMVKEILDRKKVSYIHQYRIQPRDSNPLHIDFYLPDHKLVIEFDGMQHFKPVDFFGGEEGFQKRRLLDLKKDIYCVRNKIHILRLHCLDLEDMENLINFSLSKKYFTHMIFSASYTGEKTEARP